MLQYKSLKRGSLLLLLGLVCLISQLSPQPTLARETNAAAVQHLTLSDNGLTFSLHTPHLEQDQTGWLTVPGLEARTNIPGAPDIPFYATTIVLPPEATLQVNITPADVTTHAVNTVRPVPSATLPTSGDNVSLDSNTLIENHVRDETFYQTNAIYPDELYTVSEPMYVRDVRLVRLFIYPLHYNAVEGSLTHSARMDVSLTFVGADFSQLQPAPSYQDNHLQMVEGLALNASQARQWRSLPRGLNSAATVLPVGQTAYKIAVSQDGIHEVTYAALGLSGSYNPATIQMLYDGEAVAFAFINRGGTANFDSANDAVRFYGWAFNGSRHDQQYVTDNIFWLWVGGAAANITTTPSLNGLPVAPSFPESITAEQNLRFTSTFVPEELWFDNEPDAWYWDLWTKTSIPITKTYTINTPNPVASGNPITFTTEILSRGTSAHLINSYLNYSTHGSAHQGTHAWSNNLNVNVVGTAPVTALANGSNQITVGTHSPGTASRNYLLNRITVEYQRQFIATSDQLIFNHVAGSHQYNIQGYSQNNPSNILIWNITNPYQPVAVTGSSTSGSGPYTYAFGSNNSSNARFIATTTTNIINVPAGDVSSYFVTNLEPATGQVDWLAISYADFLPATNQLATHRQNTLYGDYRTHVVDVQHIVNQYGYGLETPSAIHDYLAHALADWQVAPSYVLLVGDASADVRHIWVGNGAPSYWDASQISYVNTDMLIIDRYQGLVPTDHSYVLLAGADILPDMAIGRLAAQSNAEAVKMVNKIIQYEENHIAFLTNPSAYQWLDNILFTADDYDPNAGDFCYENEVTSALIPGAFNVEELCLDDYPSVAALRTAMSQSINDGITLMNYRGHGSVDSWAGALLTTTTANFWNNAGKPIALLSMDCLDSHFIFPGFEGLGETLLGQPGGTTGEVGAAAHWSSTGLGLTHEHNYLAHGFYEGLFEVGLTAIGDAANYGKLKYYQANLHYSEMYSFTLHGDPAMQLFRPALSLDKTAQSATVAPGATVDFTLTVNNTGLYPSHVEVIDTLPNGLSYVNHTATVATTVTIVGNQLTFTLNSPLAYGDSATITLTTLLDPGYTGPALLNNQATVAGTGLEGSPGNEMDNASVLAILPTNSGLYLPLIIK